MSSPNPDTSDFPHNSEFLIYDLAAELVSEICSYLEVHDQLNMKSVCIWWRLNVSETYLSRLVDMDDVRMFNQSEDLLELELKKHVQKNTKVLILRHIHFTFRTTKFGTIARVIKEKDADLIQLILQDCGVEKEFAAAARSWLCPQNITGCMLQGLLFATRKLVLKNYTMQDALKAVIGWIDPVMPGGRGLVGLPGGPTCRPNLRRENLRIVFPRLELDCAKPFYEHYNSFIMALETNCPEVSREIRNEVALLCKSWIRCKAKKWQWRSLAYVVKWFNEGLPVYPYRDDFSLDISALHRQLVTLAFNKLTIEALHRSYCRIP